MKTCHKNPVWLSFLIVIALCTLWQTGAASLKFYRYKHLSSETTVHATAWSVKTIAADKYLPQVDYSFYDHAVLYEGTAIFYNEAFKNAWAAEQALPEFAEINRTVWYSTNDPHNSSLQKKFPLKESLSAGALWGLLVYFVWLGFYVTKYQK